jgi:hypothetical protein
VENYVRAGEPADGNMAHALCMLDTKGYKHALTICNTYCFFTQQWLQERATTLRYTYIACFAYIVNVFFLDSHRCVGRHRSLFRIYARSDSGSKKRISASSCLPSSYQYTNFHKVFGWVVLPISFPVPTLVKSGHE